MLLRRVVLLFCTNVPSTDLLSLSDLAGAGGERWEELLALDTIGDTLCVFESRARDTEICFDGWSVRWSNCPLVNSAFSVSVFGSLPSLRTNA